MPTQKLDNSSARLNWDQLQSDSSLQDKYSVAVSNKFEALYDADSNNTVQECYNMFVKCLDEVNDQVLCKQKYKRTQWVTAQSEQFREKRNESKKIFELNKTDENHARWRSLANATTESFNSDKIRYYKRQMQLTQTIPGKSTESCVTFPVRVKILALPQSKKGMGLKQKMTAN